MLCEILWILEVGNENYNVSELSANIPQLHTCATCHIAEYCRQLIKMEWQEFGYLNTSERQKLGPERRLTG